MATDARCTVNESACTARPGTRHAGVVVTCFTCRRYVCLSCAVRMEVPAQAGRTYGKHMVCHACAEAVPGGPALVAVHRARLGSHGGANKAPRGALDAVSSFLAAAVRGQPAARVQAPFAQDATMPILPARQAPAVPEPYPEARKRSLGYAS